MFFPACPYQKYSQSLEISIEANLKTNNTALSGKWKWEFKWRKIGFLFTRMSYKVVPESIQFPEIWRIFEWITDKIALFHLTEFDKIIRKLKILEKSKFIRLESVNFYSTTFILWIKYNEKEKLVDGSISQQSASRLRHSKIISWNINEQMRIFCTLQIFFRFFKDFESTRILISIYIWKLC